MLVSIVTHNSDDDVGGLLESLAEDEFVRSKCRVLVIDNASSDDTPHLLRRYRSAATLPALSTLALDANVGFGQAHNISLAVALAAGEAARPAYVWLLNPDTRPRPGELRTLVRFLDDHPRAAAVTPQLVDPAAQRETSAYPPPSVLRSAASVLPRRLTDARGRSEAPVHPHSAGWLCGAALLVRAEAVGTVGGFSRAFAMYGEDVDWSLRCRRHGWQLWVEPRATVEHIGSRSAKARWSTAQLASIKSSNYVDALERNGVRGITALLALRWLRLHLDLLGQLPDRPGVEADAAAHARLLRRRIGRRLRR